MSEDIKINEASREEVSCLDVKVLDKSFTWLSPDRKLENKRYIKSLSTSYIRYKYRILVESEGEELNQTLGLHQLYFETLEFLFSLYIGLLESPDALLIWMRKYQNAALRDACLKLSRDSFELNGMTIGFQSSYNYIFYNSLNYLDNQLSINDISRIYYITLASIKAALLDYNEDIEYDIYNHTKHICRALPVEGFQLIFAPTDG